MRFSVPVWILRGTLAVMFLVSFFPTARAEGPLHAQVLVFLPAYEGSKLYDPNLAAKGDDPPCVWGDLNAIRSAKLYLALRMPNPLEAQPMISVGPIDVYSDFVSGLTEEQDTPGFQAYTPGADFFDLRLRLAAGDRHGYGAAVGAGAR